MDGKEILKKVQQRLSIEQETFQELLHQVSDAQATYDKELAGLRAACAEKDEVIREQMSQIMSAQENSGDSAMLEEKEEVIREQMGQILELSEKIDALEERLKAKA